MSVNLSTKIAGIRLSNCMYNASGVNCITGDELHILGKSKFTAVIQTKSCTLNSREGNPLPRYYDNSICSINSSGLPNLGYKYYSSISEEMSVYNKPYIVSVSGLSPNDNIVIVDHLKENLDVNGIELNLSCPNIVGKPQIGYDFNDSEELLRTVFELNDHRLGLKLPPYFDMVHFNNMATILDEFKPSLVEQQRHSGDIITPALLRLIDQTIKNENSIVLLSRTNEINWVYIDFETAIKNIETNFERYTKDLFYYNPNVKYKKSI